MPEPVNPRVQETVNRLVDNLRDGHGSDAVNNFNNEYQQLRTSNPALANQLMQEATRRLQTQGLLPALALETLNRNGRQAFTTADANSSGGLTPNELETAANRPNLSAAEQLTYRYLNQNFRAIATRPYGYYENPSNNTEHRAATTNLAIEPRLVEAYGIQQRALRAMTNEGGTLNANFTNAFPNNAITWNDVQRMEREGTADQRAMATFMRNNWNELCANNWSHGWSLGTGWYTSGATQCTREDVQRVVTALRNQQSALDSAPTVPEIQAPGGGGNQPATERTQPQPRPGYVSDLVSQYAGNGEGGQFRRIAGHSQPDTTRITREDVASFRRSLEAPGATPAMSNFERSMLDQLSSRFNEIANASGQHGNQPDHITAQDLTAYAARQQQMRALSTYFAPEGTANPQQSALNAFRALSGSDGNNATISQADLQAALRPLPPNASPQDQARQAAARYLADNFNAIASEGQNGGAPTQGLSQAQIFSHIRRHTHQAVGNEAPVRPTQDYLNESGQRVEPPRPPVPPTEQPLQGPSPFQGFGDNNLNPPANNPERTAWQSRVHDQLQGPNAFIGSSNETFQAAMARAQQLGRPLTLVFGSEQATGNENLLQQARAASQNGQVVLYCDPRDLVPGSSLHNQYLRARTPDQNYQYGWIPGTGGAVNLERAPNQEGYTMRLGFPQQPGTTPTTDASVPPQTQRPRYPGPNPEATIYVNGQPMTFQQRHEQLIGQGWALSGFDGNGPVYTYAPQMQSQFQPAVPQPGYYQGSMAPQGNYYAPQQGYQLAPQYQFDCSNGQCSPQQGRPRAFFRRH